MQEESSPQLEDGYTRIANELLEAISLYPFSGGEARVVLAILRSTYGYRGRKTVEISLAELAKRTNLSRRHVINILNNLRKSNVVIAAKEDNKNTLGVNKIYTSWRLWITGWSKLLHFTSLGNGVSPK